MITNESKNIIVADDSEFFRVKISDILTEAGHKVRVVKDGAELIKEIQLNPNAVDMVLLDLQMPNTDGFGVLKWIKDSGLKGKFHVLAITGVYEPTRIMDKLKSAGAEGLMTKAFTPEEIIYRVNKALFPAKGSWRSDPRVPLSVPVDFNIGDEGYSGYVLNISISGVFLHTRKTLFPGTNLHMKFTLPGSRLILNVRGLVKWCTQMSGEKSLFGGAGVQFLSLTPEYQKIISDFLQTELRKLGLGIG